MANREEILQDDFRQFRMKYDTVIANLYVAKVSGKGLSTNDFTNDHVNNLNTVLQVAQPITTHSTYYYTGRNQRAVWAGYDPAKMTMNTVSSALAQTAIPTLSATASNANLEIKSATVASDAGYYVVSFTPISPYYWKGTNKDRSTKYSSWVIGKANNDINLTSQSERVHYGEINDIGYTTADGTAVTVSVPDVVQHSTSNSATTGSKENMNRLPYLNTLAYHHVYPTTDSAGNKIIRMKKLYKAKSWYWTYSGTNANSPVITVTSAASNNYKKVSKTIQYKTDLAEYTLDLPANASDTYIYTTSAYCQTIDLEYDGPEMPSVSTSNNLCKINTLYNYTGDTGTSTLKSYATYNDLPSTATPGTRASIASVETTETITRTDSAGHQIRSGYPLVYVPVNKTKKWFWYEYGYNVIDTQTLIVPPKWNRGKDDDTSTWTLKTKAETIENKKIGVFENMTLVVTPKGSLGTMTVTLKTKAHNMYSSRAKMLKLTIKMDAATNIGTNSNYATIKNNLSSSSVSRSLYKIGDYFEFTFSSEVTMENGGATINKTDKYRAVLIGIDHNKNSTVEGKCNNNGTLETNTTKRYTAGHFCIFKNGNGELIAFNGKRMKARASASNDGGWANSDLNTWLNNTTDGFITKLPFAGNIALYQKPTYCGGTINTTKNKIWLMSYKEITGKNNSYIDNTEENACVQYDYFTYNNSWSLHYHDNVNDTCGYWTRDIRINNSKQFMIVKGQDFTDYPSAGNVDANQYYGVAPCFVF